MYKLVILGMILSCQQLLAMDVNIYHSPSYKKSSVIELVDNCGQKHKLIIKNDDLKDPKNVTDWYEKLSDSNKLDKCLKNSH